MSERETHADDSLPTEFAGLPAPALPRENGTEDYMPSIQKEEATAVQVFSAWEKLRLIYNAVLVSIVAWTLAGGIIGFLKSLIECAIVANLCFCAGPVVEGYLCWLGTPRVVVRWIIFVIGTLVAIGYTFYCVDRLKRHVPLWE